MQNRLGEENMFSVDRHEEDSRRRQKDDLREESGLEDADEDEELREGEREAEDRVRRVDDDERSLRRPQPTHEARR